MTVLFLIYYLIKFIIALPSLIVSLPPFIPSSTNTSLAICYCALYH